MAVEVAALAVNADIVVGLPFSLLTFMVLTFMADGSEGSDDFRNHRGIFIFVCCIIYMIIWVSFRDIGTIPIIICDSIL